MGVAATRIRVVSAEIEREGTYLITQRLPRAVLPGLWEFPGGRVRDGESDEDALRRSLRGRLGVEIVRGPMLMETTHAYDTYTVTLAVYSCAIDREPEARKVAAVKWVTPETFGDYEFPGADQQTVDLLLGFADLDH